ncbi:alpha/beta hydrolase [candidate division KSB1 bacterium]
MAALFFIIIASFLIFGGLFALLVTYLNRDNIAFFQRTKGKTTGFTSSVIRSDNKSVTEEFSLSASGGFNLDGYIKFPAEQKKKYPAFIILGGLFTGKELLTLMDDIQKTEPFITVTIDYPYEGEKQISGMKLIRSIPEIRNAGLNTVRGLLLLIDTLKDRTDIDRDRIFMIGVSFGSFFGLAAAACDPSVKLTAVLYGGGHINPLIAANLPFRIPGINQLIGLAGSWIVRPLEPLQYVHSISPRPLLIIAGKNDPKFPYRCAQALYNRAKEPKEIIWFSSAHPQPTRNQLVSELTVTVVKWLKEHEYISED